MSLVAVDETDSAAGQLLMLGGEQDTRWREVASGRSGHRHMHEAT